MAWASWQQTKKKDVKALRKKNLGKQTNKAMEWHGGGPKSSQEPRQANKQWHGGNEKRDITKAPKNKFSIKHDMFKSFLGVWVCVCVCVGVWVGVCVCGGG